ncbi:MAG: zeta toxin family protein, partial [Bdellovibrionota bacterium]
MKIVSQKRRFNVVFGTSSFGLAHMTFYLAPVLLYLNGMKNILILFLAFTTGAVPYAHGEEMAETIKEFAWKNGRNFGPYASFKDQIAKDYKLPVFDYARQQLHDKIINEFLKEGTSSNNPKIVMLSGPSGAGKSTTIGVLKENKLLNPEAYIVIDADRIKEMIPEYRQLKDSDPGASDYVHEESSFLAHLLLRQATSLDMNIIFDSTLTSMKSWNELLDNEIANNRAYERILIRVFARPEILKKRILQRAAETGRMVSDRVLNFTLQKNQELFEKMATNDF